MLVHVSNQSQQKYCLVCCQGMRIVELAIQELVPFIS